MNVADDYGDDGDGDSAVAELPPCCCGGGGGGEHSCGARGHSAGRGSRHSYFES